MPKKRDKSSSQKVKLSPEASSAQLSPHSAFDPPAEPDWHRRIAEAAYFIAEKRGFTPGDRLTDWLAAEEAVKASITTQK